MPAKWQRWMPFEIDAFRGSPSVQAMHPAARAGYLYLLADAWQTDDCTIGSDPIELADRSGLGDELWAVHGPRILRKFERVEGTDRLRNAPLYERWLEAKRVHDARREAAHRINSHRSPQQTPSVTGQSPSQSVDTHTRTNTDTSTKTKTKTKAKNTTLPGTSPGTEKPKTKTQVVNERHAVFKETVLHYWRYVNPPPDGIEMPWDGAEGKALALFLQASPNLTVTDFRKMLHNRSLSEGISHTERPCTWLRTVTKYAKGPLDPFGKLLGTKGGNRNGNGNYKSKGERVLDAGREALANLAARYGADGDGTPAGSGTDGEDPGVIRGEVVRPAEPV